MARLLTLALAVLALAPSSASAATRYATQAPSEGAQCTSAEDACSLAMSLEVAQAGDDVQLAAGNYEGPIRNAKAITIHGAPGTRPTISSSSQPVVSLGGGTLSDVEVHQQNQKAVALFAENATVERVIASALSFEAVAMSLDDGAVVRSSAALAPEDGTAIAVGTAPNAVQLRNVTATGKGAALSVDATRGYGANVSAINTILLGPVHLLGYPSSEATLTLGHSAYKPESVVSEGATVVDAGGNLTSDPVLLAVNGISQDAKSPTVDAGVADQTTKLDFEGDARAIGPAPDIGADERPEPPVKRPPNPTPTPTPAPQPPAPTPAQPAPSGDLTLSARFAAPPVAGRPSDLVIETSDPDSAILGVVVDLGPAGVVGLSACTTLKPSGPFVPGKPLKFTVPVVFPAPGLQPYTLEVRSGGCGGAQQVSRSDGSTQVVTGALIARAAQAARCSGPPAQAVVCLMNRERSRRRLKPLTIHPKLTRAAAAHSADMLSRGYYNHQRPGGPALKGRLRKAGYRGNAGENLGLASGLLGKPAQMMKMWMKSPIHRANILRRQFRAVGVVVEARDPMKRMRGAAVYTVNFGTRK